MKISLVFLLKVSENLVGEGLEMPLVNRILSMTVRNRLILLLSWILKFKAGIFHSSISVSLTIPLSRLINQCGMNSNNSVNLLEVMHYVFGFVGPD